jgi:signal transduction histidine kinase
MTTQRAVISANDVSAAEQPSLSPFTLVRRIQGFVGQHLSIRWKLTIWYAVIYVVSLAAIALALPAVFQARNNHEIDLSLKRTAAQVLNAPGVKTLLPAKGRGTFNDIPRLCRNSRPVLERYCSQIQTVLTVNALRAAVPGQYEQAQLAGYGPGCGGSNPSCTTSPLVTPRLRSGFRLSVGFSSPKLAEAVMNAVVAPVYTNVSEGGADYRAYLIRINPPPEVAAALGGGILEVLQKQTTYAEVQAVLLKIILIIIPFTTLLALVVGWFVARAALRPIGRISRTVQTIGGSRDLSRRLQFVGPMDEIGRLAATFDDMMDRLEESFETQKRFIADASHELRTPLTAIRGNADLITIAPPDERDQCISAIRREAERMSRLVNDLLLLAEADIAEQPIHPRTVDLADVVEDVFRAAQLLGGDKVEVVLERADSVETQADPDRIKQLLLNLIDNAVKFTPSGGVVSLRLTREGDWAEVAVSDTGVGIAPEEQAAIFRRFYRVDTSRSTKGSGLGLAICAWIVHAHKGTIAVSSNPGQGSTFAVRLPITLPDSSLPSRGAPQMTSHR